MRDGSVSVRKGSAEVDIGRGISSMSRRDGDGIDEAARRQQKRTEPHRWYQHMMISAHDDISTIAVDKSDCGGIST